MSAAGSVWIGADPGGKGKFGIAVLQEGGEALTGALDCADEAVAFVRGHFRGTPKGVGVDAPLWWSSGPSGDRKVDQWIRKRYKIPSRLLKFPAHQRENSG